MSDEEKQPDSTSQQMDETVDSQEAIDTEAAATEGNAPDLELPLNSIEEQTAVSAQANEGENGQEEADFENFRRRTAKEKEELELQVKRTTLSELLPVVDNFERARAQIKPQNDGEMAIHKSYQGVYKQMVDCLKRIGVAAMRPEGQEFDPNLHEAVLREPSNEYPEGVVIEQLQRGYFLGERVLRHAMVKVAAAPESPSEESGENSATSSE
jgi:molecular chaperone GrpE